MGDLEDMREGDRTRSDLWYEYHAQRRAAETGRLLDEALRQETRRDAPPPPPHLDFRMG